MSNTAISETPSPFYELMLGAAFIQVGFPDIDGASLDSCGLKCDEDGYITPKPDADLHTFVADVEVVQLGPDRFRLAEWGLMSEMAHQFNLYWGDEFFTERTAKGIHIVTRFVNPQPFVHLTSIERPVRCGVDVDDLVHELGGGWTEELMLKTWSIPRERLDEFYSRIRPTEELG